MQVLKKNGVSVPYDVSKINSFLELITEGIENVSMSDIIMNSNILLYDGISTSQINSIFIKSAENLITEDTPNYDLVAGRILMSEIRKSAYGDFDPDDLYEIVTRNVLIGRYDPELLIHYTKEEFDHFDMFIDHDRDLQFSIAGVREWEDKYLVKDKKSNQFFESPQVSYILMAMSTFMYDQGNEKYSRSDLVKLRYEHLSLGYVNSPTPQSAGLRTSTRNYSSCVLIEAHDSIDGISAVERVAKKYATLKAGLGIGVQGLRATNQPIRNGEAINTGVLPHAKSIELSATSCSQGGIRKGSCTFNWLGWHLDFEDIVRYKNGAKLDDDSMKHSDHSILINEYLWTRALNNEDIWLFSPEQVPDLYNSFFLGDNAIFEKLYLEAIDMPGIAKKKIPATEWIFPIVTERFGTGRIYLLMMDNTNKYSPFIPELAPVRMSNLCVAGDTLILTDKGHIRIDTLVDQYVNVWNGYEWSNVQIRKTGTNQSMLRITLSDGRSLDSTDYHKWYIIHNDKEVEVRTKDLSIDNAIIKYDLPVVDGSNTLDMAYTNGFYSGDGCFTGNKQRIYLYHDKRNLIDFLDSGYDYKYDQQNFNRIYLDYSNLKEKFFVPDGSYSISSRLEWLSGYMDADGCVYVNGSNEQLTCTSVNFNFLKEIQFMLQTLGVNAKITQAQKSGPRQLPLNDGSGNYGFFECQESWRLLITSYDVIKLLDLGISFNRISINRNIPNRSASRFAKVISIEKIENSDTYCFEEPLRHRGVFNGILTGQCVEINQHTEPLKYVTKEDGSETIEGLIALCNLGGINFGLINNIKDLEEICMVTVRAIDNLLDLQYYPFEAARLHNELYRPMGIGITGLAYWLAKNDLTYSNCYELLDEWVDFWSYSIIKASMELSREKGACKGFKSTKWSQGILPVDNYAKAVDEIYKSPERDHWNYIRENIQEYGIRNATLMAIMPSETSAKISGRGTTNGVEPIRDFIVQKGGKSSKGKFVAPELSTLRDKYDLVWSWTGCTQLIYTYAIIQKYTDQSLSANSYYGKNKFPGGKIPVKTIIKDITLAIKYGLKSLYYNNNDDDNTELFNGNMIVSPQQEVTLYDDDNDCESCKL